MSEITFNDLSAGLNELLNRLNPAQTKKALHEIANYLRKTNRARIRQQRNVDGSAYAERKDQTVNQKMLIGFNPHIRKRVSSDGIEVGILGKAAQLAQIHHAGEVDDGIPYPARELMGWTNTDLENIRNILLKHIL